MAHLALYVLQIMIVSSGDTTLSEASASFRGAELEDWLISQDGRKHLLPFCNELLSVKVASLNTLSERVQKLVFDSVQYDL